MKVRNGFVSNSSSSSFILKFNKLPESEEEVRVLLYGENPPILTSHWGDDAISTKQVAKVFFKDIESSRPMGVDDVVEKVLEEIGYFFKYNLSEGFGIVKDTKYESEFEILSHKITKAEKENDDKRRFNKNHKYDWKAENDQLTEISKPMIEIVEKVLREQLGEEIMISTEYSDNDGHVFSYLEHSGILDKITIQRFSHH